MMGAALLCTLYVAAKCGWSSTHDANGANILVVEVMMSIPKKRVPCELGKIVNGSTLSGPCGQKGGSVVHDDMASDSSGDTS